MPFRLRLSPVYAVPVAAVLLTLSAPLRPAGAVDPDGVWPLDPRPQVVEPFAPPETPFGPGHRGADLAGRPGQWVRTALPGRVIFAGVVAGRGVVVVDHGPTRTTYEPVGAAVAVGDRVDAGDVVGLLELTGSHCFPAACLHWGWRRGASYLDPLRLVGDSGPVRLWPWAATPASQPRVATAASAPWSQWVAPLASWAQALGCACW